MRSIPGACHADIPDGAWMPAWEQAYWHSNKCQYKSKNAVIICYIDNLHSQTFLFDTFFVFN